MRSLGLPLCLCLAPLGVEAVELPYRADLLELGEGCRWAADRASFARLEMNGSYIAPPGDGVVYESWLAELRAWRDWTRANHGRPEAQKIGLSFDGVRAWTRFARSFLLAAELRAGETVVVRGEARAVAGNRELCLAFDRMDRAGGADGRQLGWSTVLATAEIPAGGEWHAFVLTATVPELDPAREWWRPIVGQDATRDATPGELELRALTLALPDAPGRAAALALLLEQAPPLGFDDAIYDRADLAWAATSFVCGFLFCYDRSFWDPEAGRYRIEELCAEAREEFGGYDSVVLWPVYPRIGLDQRNQWDFFRDLPGGLDGLRDVVRRFHAQRVRVFLPYKPWDQGTRREAQSDVALMAEFAARLELDGWFLDTMSAAPGDLRAAVDAARPGVVFEPEGHPSLDQIQLCNASWAQGVQPYPNFGILQHKWLEPRHLQHQIRRWDARHRDELAAAWLNGSGMLVWENIFGSFNPWTAIDRQSLRRMVPVLRRYAPLLLHGEWRPYVPTAQPAILASLWQNETTRLWTLVNQGEPTREPALAVEPRGGERFLDLWHGQEIWPFGGTLAVPIDDFGAILGTVGEPPAELLAGQRAEVDRLLDDDDRHVAALPVVDPLPPPDTPAPTAAQREAMPRVDGVVRLFPIEAMRRECGTYPDPDTSPHEWYLWLKGWPHDEILKREIRAVVEPFHCSLRVVTGAEYEAFLRATGYRPAEATNFLRAWGGRECPAELADRPVTYVDLGDARAYAAWAGARLPTEWEWHQAAETLGERFVRGEVWELTESERDDGHTRFVMLRGGSRYRAEGSIWYFAGGEQPIGTHAKMLLLYPGLDRCATVGFRVVVPAR